MISQKRVKSMAEGVLLKMPTISMFYGIIIRMYCTPKEHNPPHFHAYYQDYKAIIDITPVN